MILFKNGEETLIGMVKTAIQTVSDAMAEAVSKGLFPGAVLLVHYRKQVLHEAYGYASLVPQQTHMTQDTLFDVASLTKAVATTTAIMCLIADRQISLNDPVSRFIPDFLSPDRQGITLFHLLTHSSGLPDWRPFYREVSRLTQQAPRVFTVTLDLFYWAKSSRKSHKNLWTSSVKKKSSLPYR
jgi:CubicO group peptidase (beta-lactamase class C family)